MAGLRPVVEIMMIDFVAVAADALVNHAAKLEEFSGGRWSAPMVVRASCGGGYGDGGQHEQSLWGWLAQVPGIEGRGAFESRRRRWLDVVSDRRRGARRFHGAQASRRLLGRRRGRWRSNELRLRHPRSRRARRGPKTWEPIPIGEAKELRNGDDLTIVSLGRIACIDVCKPLNSSRKTVSRRG